MKEEELKPKNERETMLFLLGQLKGLNQCRLSVWGFGYDNDSTGNMIRKFTCDEINRISEMIQLSKLIDHSFSDLDNFDEKLTKEET